MSNSTLREVRITDNECRSKEDLHAFLQRELELPDYYGKNLSALADCLAETGTPLLMTISIEADRLPAGMGAYVLRMAQVCAREALANENVSLIIAHHPQ